MVLGVEIEQRQFVARCLNQRTYFSAELPVKWLAQSKILRMSEFPLLAGGALITNYEVTNIWGQALSPVFRA
jgi:hypothetical protein